jgi:glycosyltransferase involved in cell wall biosynthesis
MRLDILFAGQLAPCRGGAAIVASQFLAGFAAAGHRVRAVAPRVVGSAWTVEHCAKANPGIAISCYPAPDCVHGWFRRMDEGSRLQERRLVRRLVAESIASERPDVVVFGKTPYAWHAADLVAAAKVPSVLVCQGAWAAELATRVGATDLLEQLRRVSRVVTVADHMILPLHRLGLANVSAIPNGVDLTRFAPRGKNGILLQRLGLTTSDVVVFHASNLVEAKRPLDIVRSAQLVLSRAPEFAYVIAGDGYGRAAVEEACHAAGVIDRFRFTGWLEHADIAEYMNLADIVVMTSESEALPLVYLEAQACGKVLVASDIPASREVIVDGQNGLLFHVGDTAALTASILQLGQDADLRRAIGDNARRTVGARDVGRTVAAHLAVVADVATRNGGH